MGALFDYLKEMAAAKEEYSDCFNYENYELINEVRKTMKELKDAEIYFQNVTDPDLVDHAIYKLESLRKKYIYLIKKAKKDGINLNDFNTVIS